MAAIITIAVKKKNSQSRLKISTNLKWGPHGKKFKEDSQTEARFDKDCIIEIGSNVCASNTGLLEWYAWL